MRLPPQPVGILGGMGPAAGADLLRLFVQACTEQLRSEGRPVHDQSYPPHWLAQLPVADRSAALADANAPQPLQELREGLASLAALGARTVAIACNTAHAWHGRLQEGCPSVRVLHVMDEVAAHLAMRGFASAGLLATEGTYGSGLYQEALARRGMACVTPQEEERKTLMRAIYSGVKAGRLAEAALLFEEVAHALAARHSPPVLILGCTEIPLAFSQARAPGGMVLVDPAQVLARRLAAWAYGGAEA